MTRPTLLSAKPRYNQLSSSRTRTACRLHALLAELLAGGSASKLKANEAERLLATITPATPMQAARHAVALEHLEDLRRVDTQLAESPKRIVESVAAWGTSVTDIVGVGPIVAAMVIGYTGDVHRLATRHRYAAYTGTARSRSLPGHASSTGCRVAGIAS